MSDVPSMSCLRVLIADKNTFYRRVLRQNLMPGRQSDMQEAESALDAVGLLLAQPFDLFVVDWDLLIANDGALLELIVRRAKMAKRKMPVMALMQNPTQSSVLHASNNNIDMILRKPFSPKALQQRMRWIVDQRES